MIIHDVQQRSPEWTALRLGRLCGSRAADMLAMKIPPAKTPTGKPSTAKPEELAGRRNLRVQLVLERLTGKSHERNFQSQAMQDGIDRESEALAQYELLGGRLVRSIGYIAHHDLMAGFSPDSVVGDMEGIVEAKSPLAATHLEYLRTGIVPLEYMRQCVHGLWISDAGWCDWLSFHPEFPEHLQVKIVRIHRDESAIKDYDTKARAFLDEVDRELQAVCTLTNIPGELQAVAI